MSPSGPRKWTLVQKQHLSIPLSLELGRSSDPQPQCRGAASGSSGAHSWTAMSLSMMCLSSDEADCPVPSTFALLPVKPEANVSAYPGVIYLTRYFPARSTVDCKSMGFIIPFPPLQPFHAYGHVSVLSQYTCCSEMVLLPSFLSFWISCSSSPEPSNEVVPLCSCPYVFKNNLWPCAGIRGVFFLNSQAHMRFFGKKGFWNNSSLLWIGEIHKPGEIHKLQETILGAVGLLSFNLRLSLRTFP